MIPGPWCDQAKSGVTALGEVVVERLMGDVVLKSLSRGVGGGGEGRHLGEGE